MKIHAHISTQQFLVAAMVLAILPLSGQAFQIKNQDGNVIGSFDTTLSIAGSWRTQGRDSSLVGITNGGASRDINNDDGNLNYNNNKLFSSSIRVTHELGLK